MGLTIVAMITASVVVVVGSISYIGLIVPNIVAMFKGDKIRETLVDTALFGALFVLVCDMIGRIVIAPYELPIELVIGILGSLLFIGLLLYRLKHGRKAVTFRTGGAPDVRKCLDWTEVTAHEDESILSEHTETGDDGPACGSGGSGIHAGGSQF